MCETGIAMDYYILKDVIASMTKAAINGILIGVCMIRIGMIYYGEPDLLKGFSLPTIGTLQNTEKPNSSFDLGQNSIDNLGN